jgi:SHS2 domain-containing protein
MPYRFLEDIAIADVAFEAWGASREEMFKASAAALMNTMVADLETIHTAEEVYFNLENDSLEMLLFDFLNEFIFHKDARLLLLRPVSLTIMPVSGRYTLHAVVRGERLDPARHPLTVDVKAVTLHRFQVEETTDGWRAVVVLDI